VLKLWTKKYLKQEKIKYIIHRCS